MPITNCHCLPHGSSLNEGGFATPVRPVSGQPCFFLFAPMPALRARDLARLSRAR
jgi:hypothetical protein